jgi:hypothetical protein
LVGCGFDGGKNVGRPPALKAAHHCLGRKHDADALERVGKHRSRDGLTVDEHAITIEDDQWSLRPAAGSPAAVQLFEESTTRNISPVAAMQRARVISPIIMHRNQIRLWMTRRPPALWPLPRNQQTPSV